MNSLLTSYIARDPVRTGVQWHTPAITALRRARWGDFNNLKARQGSTARSWGRWIDYETALKLLNIILSVHNHFVIYMMQARQENDYN